MAISQPLPQTISANQPVLGANEISLLLDTLDKAAFLIDSLTDRIIAVNAKATELTAYTRTELTGILFRQIASYGDKTGIRLKTRDFKNTPPTVKLSSRNRKNILSYARTTPVTQQWRLITLEPVQTASPYQINTRGSQALTKIFELISASQHSNPNIAIAEAIKIGRNLLEADTLTLYIGNGPKPSIRKIVAEGKEDLFPPELSPMELKHFIKPTLWTHNQRSIVTLLHQSARSAGYSYLTSTPIGNSEALIGILLAGGYQDPVPSNIQDRIKIMGAMISAIIDKGALIANLQNTLQNNAQTISVLEAAKDTISDGVILVSGEFKIEEINQSAEMILGYGNNEVHNMPVSDILVGTDRLVPALELALQGGSTPNLGNTNLVRRDGSEFPAELSTTPVLHQDEIFGVLIILHDKSHDEQNRVRTQQLEQRALLGEVTAIFAHEVRNPVNNISTGLQLMAENLAEDQENQELIARLQQDCHRLTDLMESVLTFSRSGNYVFRPIPIVPLIERLVRLWTPRMERLNIKPMVKIESRMLQVVGDRRALDQVFTNIISNAIQAMKNNEGGVLGVRIYKPPIQNCKPTVQIDISDSGPGIPEENRHKIFDPFFTTRKDGTGLGLSITKQIITAHKGLINLTSFPGGTVFHVKLPATDHLEIQP